TCTPRSFEWWVKGALLAHAGGQYYLIRGPGGMASASSRGSSGKTSGKAVKREQRGEGFRIHAGYAPAGDQPAAIAGLVEGIEDGLSHQTLLGVTGSGKTFTIANVIQAVQRPTIVMAPNKTLAAQLYSEFREFFPENSVEYF